MFNSKYSEFLKDEIYVVTTSETEFNYLSSLNEDDKNNRIIKQVKDVETLLMVMDEEVDRGIIEKTILISNTSIPTDIYEKYDLFIDYFESDPYLHIIEYYADKAGNLLGTGFDSKKEFFVSKSLKLLSIMDIEEDVESQNIDGDESYDDYLSLDFFDEEDKNNVDDNNNDNDNLNEETSKQDDNSNPVEVNDEELLEEETLEEEFDFTFDEEEAFDDFDFNFDDIDDEENSDEEFDFNFDEEEAFEDFDFNFDDIDEGELSDEEFNFDEEFDFNFDESEFDESDLEELDNDENKSDDVEDEIEESLEDPLEELVTSEFDFSEDEVIPNDLSLKDRELVYIIENLENSHKELTEKVNILTEELDSTKDSYSKLIVEYKNLKSEYDLKSQLNNVEVNSDDAVNELLVKEKIIVALEDELSKLRRKNSDLETNIEATKLLAKEKHQEIKKLKDELESLNDKIQSLTSTVETTKKEYVSLDKLESLQKVIDGKENDLLEYKNQIRILKVDMQKQVDENAMLKDDISNLENNYKELVSAGSENLTNVDFRELVLSDDIKTSVFYFKIISQPAYFKSFIESLDSLVSKGKKTLILIIREEDYLTDIYYPGVPIIGEMSELSQLGNPKSVILKPSKFMLGEEEKYFSIFDNVIILDYSKSKKILLKGINVYTIYTCLNDKECELLNLRGTILCNIGQSVVDIKYDNKFEFAKTAFVKKAAVSKKVKNWLVNLGVRLN